MIRLLSKILSVLAVESMANKGLFVDELSLIPPHVTPNGKENSFDFKGEYLIKTRSRNDFTQLGYVSRNSNGMIVSKSPLKYRDFEVIFDFSLNNISKGGHGAGFGFWLTDSIVPTKDFYGRNRGFNGVGVIIDIEGTPSVRYIDTITTKKSAVPIRSPNNDELYSIVMSRKEGIFTAKFIANGKENVLFTGAVKLLKNPFIGITSYSGTSTSTLNLERIVTRFSKSSGKKIYKKGERNGRGKLIIFLGAVCIGGLVYYLYHKQPKEFEMKR